MSVIVYTESEKGKFKKAAFEVVSYAKAVADQMGTSVTAVTINAENVESLGNYGASKVLSVNNANLDTFNAKQYASGCFSGENKSFALAVVDSTAIAAIKNNVFMISALLLFKFV